MKYIKIIVTFIFMLLIIATTSKDTVQYEFPLYRVVINPGHGGISMRPMSRHGDRFDSISRRYLDVFKYGAVYRGIHEHKIVYSIAVKTHRILRYLEPQGDFKKFQRILKKYTNQTAQRIYIKTVKSRPQSISRWKARRMRDPNGPYRFFDYPGRNGKTEPGRISRMNAFKPHLIVSLHLAGSAGRKYRGICPVLVGPNSLFRKGLQYLRKKRRSSWFFKGSPYKDWFCSQRYWTLFDCFLDDVSFYYTGYPLRRNRTIRYNAFRGYRHNMVTWSYKDPPGWEKIARYHKPWTLYSKSYWTVVPKSAFYDRERSKYEKFRREGGYEGYGGDNAYATYELARFMLYALHLKGFAKWNYQLGKPYMGVWIIPQHVNAISAFFELGFLNRYWDRYVLTRKQNELAEGLAIGIYSLFSGMKVKWRRIRHMPKGKKINFKKYQITPKKSYFEAVVYSPEKKKTKIITKRQKKIIRDTNKSTEKSQKKMMKKKKRSFWERLYMF